MQQKYRTDMVLAAIFFVLQVNDTFELIVHIAISVLPGTHFRLSQVKHLRVKCLVEGHDILTMSQY